MSIMFSIFGKNKEINKRVYSEQCRRVFVGVSGGVDSSVTAAILKDEGYDVTGVFIRTWTPEFLECSWRDERRDAIRVCAHLGIPFLECDGEEAYKRGVADYMIGEYKLGRTPNPDVMCNREVKFGVFWNFAKSHGADFIATGHYAQNKNNSLYKGKDESKDQCYFLWTLTKDDLSHTLFPVGFLEKSDVRKKALKYGLPTATKKDSQGICFLGEVNMKDFLKHYIEEKEGNVILARPDGLGIENGEILGTHNGALFVTLGERLSFNNLKKSINDLPYYVIHKDIEKNEIVVSNNNPLSESHKEDSFYKKEFDLINTVFREEIIENKVYNAQIRYHGEFYKVTIIGNKVIFEEAILVAPGQSIVFYDKNICIGGGIVK